jgi:hypothetical protein
MIKKRKSFRNHPKIAKFKQKLNGEGEVVKVEKNGKGGFVVLCLISNMKLITSYTVVL